ncbi:hypothetical protein, partial [Fischerella thermalis]|uniref:hypothetical protein n=1 Tax=Fischerella thermalis TaxID=372787 RepID=UPI0024203133
SSNGKLPEKEIKYVFCKLKILPLAGLKQISFYVVKTSYFFAFSALLWLVFVILLIAIKLLIH